MSSYILNINKYRASTVPQIVGRVADLPKIPINIELKDGDTAVDLTDAKVEFRGVTPDNKKLIVSSGIDVTNAKTGSLTFTFPKNFYTSPGRFKRAYFVVKRGDKLDSTQDLIIHVIESIDFDLEDSKDIIEGLDQVIKEVTDNMNRETQAMIDEIQKEYDNLESLLQKQAEENITNIDREIKVAIDESKTRIGQLESEYRSIINNAQSTLNQLNEEVDKLKPYVDETNKKLDELSVKLKNIQDDLDRTDLVTQGDLNERTHTKGYIDEKLKNKRNKTDKINRSDMDISTDDNRLGLQNLSQEVHNAMSGNAPVNPDIADESITSEKIAPLSINSSKRTVLGDSISLATANEKKVNIDTNKKTITFPSNTVILSRDKSYNVSEKTVDYSEVDSTYVKIFYNVTDGSFECMGSSAVPKDKENTLLILSGFKNGNNWHAPFDFTVNNEKIVTDSNLASQQIFKDIDTKENVKITNAYDLFLEQEYLKTGTGGKIYLRFNNLQARGEDVFVNFDWNVIKSQIDDEQRFVTTPSGKKDYLQLADGESLVFDIAKKNVRIITSSLNNRNNKEILLAYAWRGRLRDGVFSRNIVSELYEETQNNTHKVDSISEKVKTTPLYIKEEHKEVYEELINNHQKETKFIFTTDEHGNDKQHSYISEFAENGQIDAIFSLGDLNDSTSEKSLSSTIEAMSKVAKNYYNNKTKMAVIRGNHDGVIGNTDFTDGHFSECLCKPFGNEYSKEGASVLTFEKEKIKVILLNSSQDVFSRKGLTDEQIVWFTNQLNASKGYHLITATHHPLVAEMIPDIFDVKNNIPFNADKVVTEIKRFKSEGGIHITHINGHLHHDLFKNVDGINYITLNRGIVENTKLNNGDGATDYSKVEMKEGTNSEYSCDIMSVDTKNNKFSMIRLGAGLKKQRVFDY